MNILHKLGLYRAGEIDELIESTVNLLSSVDGVIEGAKLDRQCYKAAISAFREVNTVEHAMDVLKAHCGNQRNCIECIFHDGKCKLAHTPPCWWGILEVSK